MKRFPKEGPIPMLESEAENEAAVIQLKISQGHFILAGS